MSVPKIPQGSKINIDETGAIKSSSKMGDKGLGVINKVGKSIPTPTGSKLDSKSGK